MVRSLFRCIPEALEARDMMSGFCRFLLPAIFSGKNTNKQTKATQYNWNNFRYGTIYGLLRSNPKKDMEIQLDGTLIGL
jgi:hypothetical protein